MGSVMMNVNVEAATSNQHVFIPFAFDTFGFLAPKAEEFLNRVQRVVQSNFSTPKTQNFIFSRIGFAIQKGVAAQLKCKGKHQGTVLVPLPQLNKESLIEMQPMKLLDRKMVKRGNAMTVYGLIQWTNGDVQDATWELLEELCQRFPE
ncbi:putative exostosin-like protein, partial [Tanacetum coccineum]